MSRTDPILMAKNGKNCLQFFKPRLMLQLPLLEKKMHYFPFDPHAEFPHGDIPRSPPCASPLHGWSWTMAVLFGFKKRFHWGPQNPAISRVKRQNLTSHGGLSRLSRLKKWNIDEYCLFKVEICGNDVTLRWRFFRPSKKGAFTFEDLESWLEMFNQPSKGSQSLCEMRAFFLIPWKILVGWWGFPVGLCKKKIPSQSWVNHQPGSALHHQPG